MLVASSGKGTSKLITGRKSAGLNGTTADADTGRDIEFLAQMSLYQYHSGFPSGLSVAKSGFVWQLPWQLLTQCNFRRLCPHALFLLTTLLVWITSSSNKQGEIWFCMLFSFQKDRNFAELERKQSFRVKGLEQNVQ